jgi:hypothetical protein
MASAVSKDFKTSLPNHLSPCCVCGLLSGAGKMLLKLLVGPIINFREANVGYCGGNDVRGIRTVGERRSRMMSAILGLGDEPQFIWKILKFLTIKFTTKRRNLFAMRWANYQRRQRRQKKDSE